MVYLEKAVVPEGGDLTIPFGQANVVKEGSDITVVAYSNMVGRSITAAEILEKEEGLSVEIVDPRTLVPLDVMTISESVKKTGRAVVITQAPYTGGYASHISHEITLNCFKEMKCPVRIISLKQQE